MKQHSFAFYNGHLSEEFKTRTKLQRKLEQLDDFTPAEIPSGRTPLDSLPTSYLDHSPAPNQRDNAHEEGASNIARITAAITAGEELGNDQIQTFERIMKWEIDALTTDLNGKSTGESPSWC